MISEYTSLIVASLGGRLDSLVGMYKNSDVILYSSIIEVFHPVQMETVGTSTLSAFLESLAMLVNFSEYCVMTGKRKRAQNTAKRTKKITVFTACPIYTKFTLKFNFSPNGNLETLQPN